MRKEKLKRIPHLISGGIILLHAYERYEHGHASWLFFLVSGLIFLSVAIFHHPLAARFRFIDVLFYSIEGILSLIIGYEYYEAGKKALPFAYLFATLMQVIAIFIFVRRKKNKLASH